jgi:hypothetical protein
LRDGQLRHRFEWDFSREALEAQIMSWPLNSGEIISGLGAGVAFCAMIVTLWFARRNLKLQIAATELQYFEDFQKWADQLADALTEAEHLCDLDPKQVAGESFFDRRHRLRIAISSMIDRGRWFLPNIVVDDHGADKELGYRGYRHELLDGPVDSYNCLQRLDCQDRESNQSIRNDLTRAKRKFVGQVQRILDPTSRRIFFDRIRDKAALMDQRAAR